MLQFSEKFCFSSVFVVYKFVLHGKQFHEQKSKVTQQVVVVLASYKLMVQDSIPSLVVECSLPELQVNSRGTGA